MQPIVNYVFAKNATTPTYTAERISAGYDKDFINNKCDICAVEISGDFSAISVVFEGKADLNAAEYTPIAAVNLSTFDYGTSATSKGVWELGLEGLQVFRARIESVSGTATILGRCTTTGE